LAVKPVLKVTLSPAWKVIPAPLSIVHP